MHVYVTHILKLGMDQRREKEGVVILSHFDKLYATHNLKLGMDQRKEKEEVVILIVICIACLYNSHTKVENGSEKRSGYS